MGSIDYRVWSKCYIQSSCQTNRLEIELHHRRRILPKLKIVCVRVWTAGRTCAVRLVCCNSCQCLSVRGCLGIFFRRSALNSSFRSFPTRVRKNDTRSTKWLRSEMARWKMISSACVCMCVEDILRAQRLTSE